MADNLLQPQRQPHPASAETQRLRQIAQNHLETIKIQDQEDATVQETMARDLQKYAKVKRKARPSPPPQPSPPESKGPKLRSAQDVLDRIRHDPSLKVAEYIVGYLERFEGLKEMPVKAWIRESTDEDWIPQHRIKYIKRQNETGDVEVVWDREARIDQIFGSGVRDEHVGRVEEEERSEAGGVALP